MTYDPTRTPEIIDFENQKHNCLIAWDNLCQVQRDHILRHNTIDKFVKDTIGECDDNTARAIKLFIHQYGDMSQGYTKQDALLLLSYIKSHIVRILSTTLSNEYVYQHAKEALNDLNKLSNITEVL